MKAGNADYRRQLEAVARILGSLARPDHPLGTLTTFRIGGPAALFVTVEGPESLESVQRAVEATGIEVLVIGRGSNLLVADEGFPGLAVKLGAFYEAVEIDSTEVVAGGAAPMPVVARKTARAGLSGFEWAVGIPGSVGGAVRMNAGGHGSDMAAVLVEAEVTGLTKVEKGTWKAKEELDLAYRSSAVAKDDIVLRARLGLSEDLADRCEKRVSEVVAWRRGHQPGGQNCGSVFANPEGDSAGRLIEEAGLKGLRIRSAQVSERHANFFQADPGGSASDMCELIDRVRDEVEARTGVKLCHEVRMVGW